MIAKRYGVTTPGQDDDVARVSVRHRAPRVAVSEFGERKLARKAHKHFKDNALDYPCACQCARL